MRKLNFSDVKRMVEKNLMFKRKKVFKFCNQRIIFSLWMFLPFLSM